MSTRPSTYARTGTHPDRGVAPAAETDLGRRLRAEQRRAAHATRLARLLAERDDLRGVSPVADFRDESLRWSA